MPQPQCTRSFRRSQHARVLLRKRVVLLEARRAAMRATGTNLESRFRVQIGRHLGIQLGQQLADPRHHVLRLDLIVQGERRIL